jgi:hypothetical protein
LPLSSTTSIPAQPATTLTLALGAPRRRAIEKRWARLTCSGPPVVQGTTVASA